MIKRWNSFIREFIDNGDVSVEYINSRMQELKDLVMDTQDLGTTNFVAGIIGSCKKRMNGQ